MLKFYFNGSPNPTKVALFLEEAGLPYEAIAVDTRKGDQFKADFLKVNPNAKVPAIVDGDTTVFDSNAILLYLAEKTGKFLPAPDARGELLSWLMFVASGVGPFSGQAVHFKHHATGEGRLRAQPLPVRGPAPLRHRQRPPRQAQVHGRRHLHDRRHGRVGLGAHGAVHSGRRRVGQAAERQAPGRRDQRAARSGEGATG